MNPKSIGSSDEKPNENKEEESQLIYQELLVDPEITVGEMLSENNVTVADFVRFEIGEEIPEESVKNEETASVL
jgi:translation elongation factor EF-Ts